MSKKKDIENISDENDTENDTENLKKNKYKEQYFKKIQQIEDEEKQEEELKNKRKVSHRRSRDRDEEMEEKVLKIKEFDMNSLPPRNVSDKSGVKIVVIGKAGCFAPGTKVLMFDGNIENVENIKIGDIIMGDDNTSRKVLELYHNYDDMYEIQPLIGTKYTVNKLHNLVLKSKGYERYKKDFPKDSIIEITVEDYLNKNKYWKINFHCFRSSGISCWEDKELFLDPYFLGLWLADIDEEFINYLCFNKLSAKYREDNIEEEGYSITKYREDTIEEEGYSITKNKVNIECNDTNRILEALKHYNLLNNKHIPNHYKISSEKTRLEVLAGLLDIDGWFDKKNYGFDIIQQNSKLADDILFIARSLGFSANKNESIKCCMYKGEKIIGIYYRIFIHGNNLNKIPTKILRKQAEDKTMVKDSLSSLFNVEYKGYGEYYGFSLDKNKRFLNEDFEVLRNTGKSTIITDIIASKSHIIPVAQVFSGTEDGNHYYSEKFPKVCVYNKLELDALRSFKKRQILAKKYLPNPWAIQILDDCTEDRKVFNQPIIQDYYKNGRHWAMLHILSLQYAMDIPPAIRTNVDYAFILREPNLRNRKNLYENYAGSCIDSFEEFEQIMDTITEDYTALVIKNMNSSNKLEDNIFWYKAKLNNIPPNWKFGHPTCWEFNNERFDPKSEDMF